MARPASVSPKTGSPETQGDGHVRLSFDDLYRDHVDRIFRYAQRLCGEPEAAKDLVQDTFLNAYRGYKDFRGESQVSTWLYTIASRACQRLRRKRGAEGHGNGRGERAGAKEHDRHSSLSSSTAFFQ